MEVGFCRNLVLQLSAHTQALRILHAYVHGCDVNFLWHLMHVHHELALGFKLLLKRVFTALNH